MAHAQDEQRLTRARVKRPAGTRGSTRFVRIAPQLLAEPCDLTPRRVARAPPGPVTSNLSQQSPNLRSRRLTSNTCSV